MRRWLAEWIWRLALLCALGWIGLELERLHEDLNQPPDDDATVAAGPDEGPENLKDSLDAMRDQLNTLTQEVNAILVVMARSK